MQKAHQTQAFRDFTKVTVILDLIGHITSEHLKGQLDPPVGDEKCVFLTKNDHFLKGPVFAT